VTVTATERQIRQSTRPTWVEVSLAKLQQNFCAVQNHVGPEVTICAVVKADAYGHGAAQCATALESAGATWFGVTGTDEGITLRDAGIRARILLMTGFWRGEAEEIIRRGLTAVVWEASQLEELDRVAQKIGAPPQAIHLKVDTGMSRLGVDLEGLDALCRKLRAAKGLTLEGVCTHFAASEVLDGDGSDVQANRFEKALKIVASHGLQPLFCHMANTSAVVGRPQSWKNMVRPGLALYGYTLPFERDNRPAKVAVPDLKPVLAWKTRVLSIKEVAAGERLGYGGTFTTKARSRIAVLPLGYADGLNRKLSSSGRVILCGHYAPMVGRISMDLTLVDVTAISGADVGDEVILIGESGELGVTAKEHADLAGTIPYEILCGISKRVPRKYSS
jgi:alanine racemase